VKSSVKATTSFSIHEMRGAQKGGEGRGSKLATTSYRRAGGNGKAGLAVGRPSLYKESDPDLDFIDTKGEKPRSGLLATSKHSHGRRSRVDSVGRGGAGGGSQAKLMGGTLAPRRNAFSRSSGRRNGQKAERRVEQQ